MAKRAEPEIDRQIWVDGTLVPWGDARVHVLSHSLQRGSLIFDYMSVHDTPRGVAIFRMPEHVARLFASAEMVGLPLERTPAEIESAIVETVRANPGARAVKVSAYLPSIEVDVVPADPRVSVAIAAYDPRADVLAHQPGATPRPETARIWVEKTVKNRRPDILPPQAKVAANYTSPMLAKWRARRAGYDEILLADEAGNVAEGPTANVFLVDGDGALVTPSAEIVLLGITRQTVLDLADEMGLTVRESNVKLDDLTSAAEVFLTGTTASVWPVESVDGKKIGVESPGPVATRLQARFRQITAGEDPEHAGWLTFVDEVDA
jgi:branched-chain amino acid aminotransferase